MRVHYRAFHYIVQHCVTWNAITLYGVELRDTHQDARYRNTLHCGKLQRIRCPRNQRALHLVVLCDIALEYIMSHYMSLHYIREEHLTTCCIALRSVAPYCLALQRVTLQYMTLNYSALRRATLHYITSHTSHFD